MTSPILRQSLARLLAALCALSLPALARAEIPRHDLRCTSIVVGRDASADGSVLLAHNEDLEGFCAQHDLAVPHQLHEPGAEVVLWGGSRLPQPAETLGYIATTVFDADYLPGGVTSGINEYQVSVANNYAPQRDADESEPSQGRILWSELTRLTLERAATAREGIELIGALVQTHRLGVDEGTMFAVTDPAEGWWIEIAQEGQWVAQRVPDDGAVARANRYKIGRVDCDDPRRFLCSDDVVSYAESRGWYDPQEDGPFEFARAYGSPEYAEAHWNIHREERLRARLAELIPRVTPRDLMALLRDHFEDTEWDLSQGYELGSPHGTDEYGVCNLTTEIGVVCQSRGWLPNVVGGLCWRAMGPPCTSVFVPWHLGGTGVPEPYRIGTDLPTPGSAWWAFRELAQAADDEYEEAIGPLREHWQAFETDEATRRAELEARVLEQHAESPAEAARLLSEFTDDRACQAYIQAEALLESGLDVESISSISSAATE